MKLKAQEAIHIIFLNRKNLTFLQRVLEECTGRKGTIIIEKKIEIRGIHDLSINLARVDEYLIHSWDVYMVWRHRWSRMTGVNGPSHADRACDAMKSTVSGHLLRSLPMLNGSNPYGAINARVHHPPLDNVHNENQLANKRRPLCARMSSLRGLLS